MEEYPHRVAVPPGVLAGLCGSIGGLLTFAAAAALWRSGHGHIAVVTADAVVVTALACVAAIALLAQPARLLRARIPVGRPVPRAWLPPARDPVPVLAAWLGVPLAAGAGVAALVFH